jgi:hypothetical protein
MGERFGFQEHPKREDLPNTEVKNHIPSGGSLTVWSRRPPSPRGSPATRIPRTTFQRIVSPTRGRPIRKLSTHSKGESLPTRDVRTTVQKGATFLHNFKELYTNSDITLSLQDNILVPLDNIPVPPDNIPQDNTFNIPKGEHSTIGGDRNQNGISKPYPKGTALPPKGGRQIRDFPHPQGRVIPPQGETKIKFISSSKESHSPQGETQTEFTSSQRESHSPPGGDPNEKKRKRTASSLSASSRAGRLQRLQRFQRILRLQHLQRLQFIPTVNSRDRGSRSCLLLRHRYERKKETQKGNGQTTEPQLV